MREHSYDLHGRPSRLRETPRDVEAGHGLAFARNSRHNTGRERYLTEQAFTPPADRYSLEREIGRGGMATVYLAHDVRHDRPVAIKVLDPAIAAEIGRDRFLREIAIAARLNHPHIVPLFDSGAAGDFLFYVMPFVEGETLRGRLSREAQLPVDEAVRLTRQVASALTHAHTRGLVHRDIKPENILLVDGMALVSDFGIARATGALALNEVTQAATLPGGVLGTPRYMSPEQVMGRDADGRSDLYSLACVLFEMLTGQPPFVAPTADAVLRMHLTADPRPVTALRPSTPPGVARVIARGLAKMPADRFGSATSFDEALAAAMSESAASVTFGTSAASRPRAARTNLPQPRTQFVGRQKELEEGVRLLRDVRLLTLTGIGGGGKTRLAIRVAEAAADDFPDGVWFVDLAPLSDEDRVLDTIAAALGVRPAAGTELRQSLKEWTTGKRLLLIFDSCEHLISRAAAVADELLAAGGELRVLATSREGLGIEGERVMTVGPLGAPAPGVRDWRSVASSDAVALFVDRARHVDPGFAITAANAEAVADICRRLDGIPLAIELAAARVKVLSVDQIRGRLGDRFRLLTGGSKSALPRHQTLQATIAWSYDQLSPEEQHLLRVLSTFAGGGALGTVAAVLGGQGDEFAVLDILSRLVDKSLVIVTRDRMAEARYGLLETVRQYACERMAETEDAAAVRMRHAGAFLALAERAYSGSVEDEGTWSALLEQEHDNLRTALAVWRELDAGTYLQLAGALAWFWQARSHLQEGSDHLIAALEAAPPGSPGRARARALWGAALVLAWQRDAGSLRTMEESLQLWRNIGDQREIALALEGLGWVHFRSGDDARAREAFEESLALQRASGDPHLVNRAAVALAQALVALGRVAEARALATDILAFSQAHHDRRSEHSAWHYFADCALLEDDCREALRLYRQSLGLAIQIEDRIEIGFEVQGVAMSLAGLGESASGLRLAASVEAEWTRLGAKIRLRFWDALLDTYLGRARLALGQPAAAEAWSEGGSLAFDTAIERALGVAGSL